MLCYKWAILYKLVYSITLTTGVVVLTTCYPLSTHTHTNIPRDTERYTHTQAHMHSLKAVTE